MSTIDKKEIEKFSKIANEWWDIEGKFKPLHKFNPSRIKYIKNKVVTHNNKIGAIVILKNSDEQLSKDICMQIVASNPLGLDENSIDKEILNNEKEVYKAELDKIDKKEDIKRNIMEGKVKKFISENTLLNQPFIKDASLNLKKILKQQFHLYLSINSFSKRITRDL